MYTTYDLNRTLLAPFNQWGAAVRELWSNPAFPLSGTPFGRAVAAGGELLERTTRAFPKPAFGLQQTVIGGRDVAVQEERVLQTPFCNLIRFQRDSGRQDPKLLLVAPLSGHHATLLRDTVAALIPDYDLYLTDWFDARLVPASAGHFDLDDYVALLLTVLRQLGPGVHAVGVCQPAVPLLAAAALLAEDGDVAAPKTLSLMGGPIDTRVRPTKVDEFATSRPMAWFERSVIHPVPAGEPGAGRKVYPGFLQLAGFISMNPSQHTRAHCQLYRNLIDGDQEAAETHRRFYDNYLAVMDVPAEYYLQTVSSVFQRHDLARGEMLWRGRKVRPELIRDTALMTIEGENDDITAPGQTFAAHALCSGIPAERKRHYLQAQAGHYGIFSGRRWREEICPRLRDFMRDCG